MSSGAPPGRNRPDFVSHTELAQKPLDQTHMVLSFAAPGYRNPEIYRLQVLSSLLGGGMSSRLFQEVREKRGLCYSVFSFASAYEDAGQFGVYAATSPDDTPELVDVTAEVMLSTAQERHRGRGGARQGAAQGEPGDEPRKRNRPRRPDRPPVPGLWRGAGDGRRWSPRSTPSRLTMSPGSPPPCSVASRRH